MRPRGPADVADSAGSPTTQAAGCIPLVVENLLEGDELRTRSRVRRV